jgi:hypothetical protein
VCRKGLSAIDNLPPGARARFFTVVEFEFRLRKLNFMA